MKLTDPQLRVLRLMREGWQLGVSISSMSSRHWLQFGGCGRGGISESVNGNTAHGLKAKKLIEGDVRKFPLQTYKLTAIGREAAGEQ